MIKEKGIKNILYGIGSGKHEYKVGRTRYIVDSNFSAESRKDIRERFGRCITHLTNNSKSFNISIENVYPTAGKED